MSTGNVVKELIAIEAEKQEAAGREFGRLALRIADGETVAHEEILAIVHATGRTLEDLGGIVERENKRRKARKFLADNPETTCHDLDRRDEELKSEHQRAIDRYRAGQEKLAEDRAKWASMFGLIANEKNYLRKSAPEEVQMMAAAWRDKLAALRDEVKSVKQLLGFMGPKFLISRGPGGHATTGRSIPARIDELKNEIGRLGRRRIGEADETRFEEAKKELAALETENAELMEELIGLSDRLQRMEAEDADEAMLLGS